MTQRGEITVLMITHKFREVTAFADAVTVLRRGKLAGGGKVGELTHRRDGAHDDRRHRHHPPGAERKPKTAQAAAWCSISRASSPRTTRACPRSTRVNLKVHAGEIVGIAGVSGNGQSELVEVLSGQREPTSGAHLRPRQAVRADAREHGQLQDLRPARGAAEERHRAAHVGGREHGVPHLRQAADHQHRLVAVARADAREGARADRRLPRQDALARERRSRTSPAATCSAPCWRASCRAMSTC